MQEKILQWLKTDRFYNRGVALYQTFGKSLSLKAILNRQGETPYNKNLLTEELRKLAKIDPDELKHILSQPVEKSAEPVSEAEHVEPANPDTTPPVTEPTEAGKKKSIPPGIRKGIRLREEFPFLSSPDCPHELKILVSDMLTAFENYKAAHDGLFLAESPEQFSALSKTEVEQFLENRAIWDELNHFKVNAAILGKHPVFHERIAFEALRKLNSADLSRERTNLYEICRLRINDGMMK